MGVRRTGKRVRVGCDNGLTQGDFPRHRRIVALLANSVDGTVRSSSCSNIGR